MGDEKAAMVVGFGGKERLRGHVGKGRHKRSPPQIGEGTPVVLLFL